VILFIITLLPDLRRDRQSANEKTHNFDFERSHLSRGLPMLKLENSIRLKCETGLKI